MTRDPNDPWASQLELARRERAAAEFEATMLNPDRQVEAHRVRGGDAVLCWDDEWRRCLASFGENAASASPTIWAIYLTAEGEPTKRMASDPGALVTIRSKVLAP